MPGRISRVRPDERIGQPVIIRLVVVLVKSHDQKAVVSFCPLVVAVEILLKPPVAAPDALIRFAVMHVVIQVWDDESDGRQGGIVGRKIGKSQIRRSGDRRPVGDIREADPEDMLACVNVLFCATVRRMEIGGRADVG